MATFPPGIYILADDRFQRATIFIQVGSWDGKVERLKPARHDDADMLKWPITRPTHAEVANPTSHWAIGGF